jgi:hypothetical protein
MFRPLVSAVLISVALHGLAFLALLACANFALTTRTTRPSALTTRTTPAPSATTRTPATTRMPDGPQLMTRQAFTNAIMNKTSEEVIQAVGRPDMTQQGSGAKEYWYYRKRTFDPISQGTDSRAQVIFRGGVVIQVNY